MKLNCDCDHQAAQVRSCIKCAKTSQVYQLPPGHKATLQIGSTYITTHLPLAIRNAMYREEMVQYIMKHAGWDTRFVFDSLVDWEARNLAWQKVRGSKKMTIFKLEFDLLATISRRSKYNSTVDNRCFRCKQLNEDVNHVLRCPAAVLNRIFWLRTLLRRSYRIVATHASILHKNLRKVCNSGSILNQRGG